MGLRAENIIYEAAVQAEGRMPSQKQRRPGDATSEDTVRIAREGVRGDGGPLPHLGRIQAAFGRHDVSDVRAHAGGNSKRAARLLRARAYTMDDAVAFDGPDPSLRLTAHEAAHVVLQRHGRRRPGVGAASDAGERRADAVAEAVVRAESAEGLLERSVAEQDSVPTVQRFEAGFHEAIERYGLTHTLRPDEEDPTGLTEPEADQVCQGNWMRDVNQFLIPLVTDRVDPALVYAALSYLSIEMFGRGFSPEELGYYIPAEHIDNPGGLVMGEDLLPGPPHEIEGSILAAQQAASGAQPQPEAYVTPQAPVGVQDRAVEGSDTSIFGVDSSGVMAFIRRSNVHLERRLRLAIEAGRTPTGLRHLGAALHTVEDLFAHSNWIEIAVERRLPALRAARGERGSSPAIFDFAPELRVPTQEPGQTERRPILTTGTYKTTDTLVSIGSEVVTRLREEIEPPVASRGGPDPQRAMIRELLTTAADALTDAGIREAVAGAAHRVWKKLWSNDESEDAGSPPMLLSALMEKVGSVPLVELYDLTRYIPEILPRFIGKVLAQVRYEIHRLIQAHVLLPVANVIAQVVLESRVADSPLIQRRDAPASQPMPPSGAERALLRDTPDHVLAGPTHSQLSKDHADSPFFGLAFYMATEAVIRLRRVVVEAWDAQGPRAIAAPTRSLPTAAAADAAAAQREREEEARDVEDRARYILTNGRDKTLSAEAEDLAQIRDSAATTLEDVSLDLLALARVTRRAPFVDDAAEQAAAAANLMEAAAGDLRTIAGRVRSAASHGDRERLSGELRAQRAALVTDISQLQFTDETLTGALIAALDRAVRVTEVSYTRRQREVLEASEARIDCTLGARPPGPYRPPPADAPGCAPMHWSSRPTGPYRPSPIDRVIVLSHEILGHPYDSEWWHPAMDAWITMHPAALKASIRARNTGVPHFRPDEHPRGH